MQVSCDRLSLVGIWATNGGVEKTPFARVTCDFSRRLIGLPS